MRFNPRAHAGRDAEQGEIARGRLMVSIHAPTRGATRLACRLRCVVVVSIHAPTRGATTTQGFDGDFLQVSIHAPTRGATWY